MTLWFSTKFAQWKLGNDAGQFGISTELHRKSAVFHSGFNRPWKSQNEKSFPFPSLKKDISGFRFHKGVLRKGKSDFHSVWNVECGEDAVSTKFSTYFADPLHEFQQFPQKGKVCTFPETLNACTVE